MCHVAFGRPQDLPPAKRPVEEDEEEEVQVKRKKKVEEVPQRGALKKEL